MTRARAAAATMPVVGERLSKRPGKAAILRAAIAVMGEAGYEGASMREIAARAGVSVAALYHHFPSKIELLREFLDEAYGVTINRLIRRMAAAEQSPPAQLDELVATMIASSLHSDFSRLAAKVAFQEYTRLPSRDRRSIDRKRRQVLKLTTGVLESGVRSGDFEVSEPEEAARAVLILTSSLVEPFGDMPRSMERMISLYQGFARGLARSG